MTRFTVRKLEQAQIAAAYPLVRVAVPGIGPRAWSACADGFAARGGALLGVFGDSAMLLGVAACRVEESLHGRRLLAEAIVTFELNHAAPARAALVGALEREAERRGCVAVELSLPARRYVDGDSLCAQAWLRHGFAPDRLAFTKPIGPRAAVAVAPHELKAAL